MKKFFLILALIVEISTLIFWTTFGLTGYLFILLVYLSELEKEQNTLFNQNLYQMYSITILIPIIYIISFIALILSSKTLIKILKKQKITLLHKISIIISLFPIWHSINYLKSFLGV